MGHGGKRERSGRKPGVPNKESIEAQQRGEIVEHVKKALRAEGYLADAKAANRRSGKDVLEMFLPVLTNMAVYHQPTPPGVEPQNPNGLTYEKNVAEFDRWYRLTKETAEAVAAFQTPKMKSIVMPAPPPEQRAPVVPPAGALPKGSNVVNLRDPKEVAKQYQRLMRGAAK